MPEVRLLTAVAALFLAPLQFLTAQGFAPPVEGTPSLLPGEKVRIWSTELAVFYRPLLFFGTRHPRLVGVLLPPRAPDSVALRRTALILAPWESRQRSVSWGEIRRLDVADGRYGAAGAVRGAGAGILSAVVVSAMYSLLSHAACFDTKEGCGPGFWTVTAVVAAVTVPVGAIWGGLSTRWRRVY